MIYRKECVLKERRFKADIVDLAKRINEESQKVEKIATSTAEVCTDEIMKQVSLLDLAMRIETVQNHDVHFYMQDMYGVVERIQTISHQLKYLTRQEATRERGIELTYCELAT